MALLKAGCDEIVGRAESVADVNVSTGEAVTSQNISRAIYAFVKILVTALPDDIENIPAPCSELNHLDRIESTIRVHDFDLIRSVHTVAMKSITRPLKPKYVFAV